MHAPELTLIARARATAGAVALRYPDREITYRDVVERSGQIAAALLQGSGDLAETRIAFLAPAGLDYVATLWAIWRAGGIAVPLSLSATADELAYVIEDSETSCVVSIASRRDRLAPLAEQAGVRSLWLDEIAGSPRNGLPAIAPQRAALILYTSGTTSKPKGVVSTHANIQAQIQSLVEAWHWQSTDCIPLFLPLHHIHGMLNVMSCALWAGATFEPFPRFQLEAILERVAKRAYSLFMAVPTIYVKLIDALHALPDSKRAAVVQGFRDMRLMVSGSAALPARVHDEWFNLTGQKLLERYGMTEIGMALANPYDGERRPGTVGQPLPGVEVRLKSETGDVVQAENQPGEIQVRGPNVFREYWQRPEITGESFDDGWFRTGDLAVVEDGYYRILGRQSVDIIKSGGYKLSALEIEATVLDHPAVAECAVVGTPDDTWGEAVAAAVVLRPGHALDLEELRAWCRDRMSTYKIPKCLLLTDSLPRNAMGKVTKPAVSGLFAHDA